MLTTQDLQAIGSVVDEKLEKKLEKKLTPIRKDLKKTLKDVSVMIKFFTEEHQALRRRVDRVEGILKISKIS